METKNKNKGLVREKEINIKEIYIKTDFLTEVIERIVIFDSIYKKLDNEITFLESINEETELVEINTDNGYIDINDYIENTFNKLFILEKELYFIIRTNGYRDLYDFLNNYKNVKLKNNYNFDSYSEEDNDNN